MISEYMDNASAQTHDNALVNEKGLFVPAAKDIPQADNYERLVTTCTQYMNDDDVQDVRCAYELAARFHGNQRRRSGEPYINHPVEVAFILADNLHMDRDVICAALLHDTVEDTTATLDIITKTFGETVATLVDGVTKLTSIEVGSMDEKQALNLRKMFLAMSKDIRVVLSWPTACTICVRWHRCHPSAAALKRTKRWTCTRLWPTAWVSRPSNGSSRTWLSFT